MTTRRLSAYLNAIADGERPSAYAAQADDVEVVRAAIALRAARPGAAAPDEAFVEGLFQRLTAEAAAERPTVTDPAARPVTRTVRPVSRPGPTHRARIAVVAAAAAGVLVTGTAVATESFQGLAATPAASAHVPHGTELRTATFQTADGRVLGQIVAYRGHPSWVFMNVDVPGFQGRIECTLQVADGTTVAFGTFDVQNGVGTFSKQIGGVNVADLRGARLVDTSGSSVAAATFT